MMQSFLSTLYTSLDIPKPSRAVYFSLRIRLLRRVVVTCLAFLRGGI